MADFKTALAKVFAQECDPKDPGRTTDIPGDNGGKTQYGISKVKHPEVDVGNLTPDSAGVFYHDGTWKHIRGDEIKMQDTANELMCTAVNMGDSGAVKVYQQALGIAVTGHMDDATLAAVNG